MSELSRDERLRMERVYILVDLDAAHHALTQALRDLPRAEYPVAPETDAVRLIEHTLDSLERVRICLKRAAHEGLDNPMPGEG